MRLSFSLSVVVLLSSYVPSQQTWKVSCIGGPGIDFTDLPEAVSAAAPGDTIYVIGSSLTCWPAPSYFTAPVIDKPLCIIGFAPHIGSPGNPNPTSLSMRGMVVISNIPKGSEVIISNFSLQEAYPSGFSPHGIHASNCQGRILLEDVSYNGSGAAMSVVTFDHCDNVVLRGCDFYLSGASITLEHSTALVSTTFVYHTGPQGFNPYTNVVEGIRATESTATLIGSIVYGHPETAQFGGRFGAVLLDSVLRVGPASTLRGGSQSGWPPRAPGFYADVGSVVEQDPRSLIEWPPSIPSTVPTDLHSTYHAWAVAGEQFPTTVAGPPGGFALLAVGDWLHTPVPTPLGLLHVDPMAAATTAIVPLDPVLGEYEWTICTSVNTSVLHAFVLQGMTLSPAGELALTIPSPLTLGWPHGVQP